MLVIEATIVAACPKGANVGEQVMGPKTKRMTSTGEAWVSEPQPVYTAGLPLSAAMSTPAVAPVDLLPGDLVLVEASDYVVYQVHRGGKMLWENKAISDNISADAAARKKKQDFYAATAGR